MDSAFQGLLNVALGKYQGQGFRIIERKGRLLLYYQDELIKEFGPEPVIVSEIRHTCEGWNLLQFCPKG